MAIAIGVNVLRRSREGLKRRVWTRAVCANRCYLVLVGGVWTQFLQIRGRAGGRADLPAVRADLAILHGIADRSGYSRPGDLRGA